LVRLAATFSVESSEFGEDNVEDIPNAITVIDE
jgi:hypothetical protein